MADSQRLAVAQVAQQPGNDKCADCGAVNPDWASCSIGIFLCQECAGIHRALPSGRVKSLRLDNWDSEHVEIMQGVGNVKAKEKYEQFVPYFLRRPTKDDVNVLKKEWIMAKYQRLEFTDPDRQSSYNISTKEGLLWKLGRDRTKVQQRKFVLSRPDNKLFYYATEDMDKHQKPKGEIDLDDINAVFVPQKIGNPCGLQITYLKNGSTRSLFIYHNQTKEIVDWYNAIRAAKLERRRIAFPDRDLAQLSEDLTRDFLLEGWLCKMGPRNEPFKRRWFTLDKRKLMYFEEPLNAFPKGEVFVGHKDSGYYVKSGAPDDVRNPGSYCFMLMTPDRHYAMRAETQEDMERWMATLKRVTEMPLTPQDSKLASILVPKKHNSIRLIRR